MLRFPESDSDDESGKGRAPEDKNDELSPLNSASGTKLLPAADFGLDGDYHHTMYHHTGTMPPPAPCPHCGHPPLAVPSAPPAEDVGTCTDLAPPGESTAAMPARANSDATSLLRLGEHEPAYYTRSNSMPAAAPPRTIHHSYTCPSCPVAAIAPPSYDDSRRDRIVL